MIPKLTLQPIVENAINHALEMIVGVCIISIVLCEVDGDIEIEIKDNGPGMSKEFLDGLRSGDIQTKGTGIGLKNVETRIKMEFGESYGININSRISEGTAVKIKIPYLTGFKAREEVSV
jgi:two-component system sensor histidine kinase YesM